MAPSAALVGCLSGLLGKFHMMVVLVDISSNQIETNSIKTFQRELPAVGRKSRPYYEKLAIRMKSMSILVGVVFTHILRISL